MQGNVIAWRLWRTEARNWCLRNWRLMVAGVLISTMLWVPCSAMPRVETAPSGEVFGPIHYWNGGDA